MGELTLEREAFLRRRFTAGIKTLRNPWEANCEDLLAALDAARSERDKALAMVRWLQKVLLRRDEDESRASRRLERTLRKALDARDEAIRKLDEANMVVCENSPPGCECPGCIYAREKRG